MVHLLVAHRTDLTHSNVAQAIYDLTFFSVEFEIVIQFFVRIVSDRKESFVKVQVKF